MSHTHTSWKEFFRDNHIFILVLFFFGARLVLSGILGGNEVETMVMAKHFMNPKWIGGDWLLNLDNNYRYIFNFIFGALALVMPLYLVSVLGRILVLILFSYLIQILSKQLRLKYYMVLVIINLWWKMQSLVAGEWIIGHLETKPFAYFCLLAALYLLTRKRYLVSLFLLGLCMSFHVLVGCYAAFCYAIVLVINHHIFLRRDVNRILKGVPLFILGAGFGFFSIIMTMVKNRDVNKSLSGFIYARVRNPHHTYPGAWEGMWLIKLLVFLILLVLIFVLVKDRRIKVYASFALASGILFVLGLGVYALGAVQYLKYYLFRLPDAIIPFYLYFLGGYVLQRLLIKVMNRSYIENVKVIKASFNILLYVLIPLLILANSGRVYLFMAKKIRWDMMRRGDRFYLSRMSDPLFDAVTWFRENTAPDANVLVDPTLARFYHGAERGMFVSFKHIPHSDKDILEWYERIKLCNGERDLDKFGFKNRGDIKNAFKQLDESIVNRIRDSYQITYFLHDNGKVYSYPVVYRNKEYVVYDLR